MREFEDVALFAEHLLLLNLSIEQSVHNGLKKVAKLIEQDAKKQIGHYQDTVGPFQDWAPLADSTENEKARLGYPIDAPLLRDGHLRDSIQHEVSGLEAVVGSKSEIAEYQEFGTKTIPPRPFIGPAAFKNKDAIQKILGHALVEGLISGQAIHESLGYDFET
jgi:HK97 gp10 family phage protein